MPTEGRFEADMWLDKDLALAVLYIGMVALSPFVYKISAASARYLFHKYLADEEVFVTYKDNGVVVAQFKVSRRDNMSVVKNIMASKKNGAKDE